MDGFENCTADNGMLHASLGMLTQLRHIGIDCKITSSGFHPVLALTNLELVSLDIGNDLNGPPPPPLDLKELSSLTSIRLHNYTASTVRLFEASAFHFGLHCCAMSRGTTAIPPLRGSWVTKWYSRAPVVADLRHDTSAKIAGETALAYRCQHCRISDSWLWRPWE